MPYSRHDYRSRRRRMRMTRRTCFLMLLLVCCAALTALLLGGLRAKPDALHTGEAGHLSAAASEVSVSPAPAVTALPTPEPTLLPVIKRVDTDRRMIAITIDDCFQTRNIHKILDIATEYDARLTFFPIGRILKNSPYTWREVCDMGFELANHTYSHADIREMSDDEIRREITGQSDRMNFILGVDYHMRFLRTMGGLARNDARVHRIMDELGYKAMAHWAVSGSDTTAEKAVKDPEPGQILLYHTTNSDLKKLRYVIPHAVSMGYELVTLSELMGYGPNEVTPLP